MSHVHESTDSLLIGSYITAIIEYHTRSRLGFALERYQYPDILLIL